MNYELHQRLKELDRSGDWETPAGFDYFRALGEIVHHQRVIEHLLGCRLVLDNQVQDASFFCELHQLDRRYLDESGSGAIVQTISIRFSAFDRMFTIFGTEHERFAERIPQVVGHLQKGGFKYVAVDELSARYVGTLTNGTENWTWFTRFFDYL